MTGITKGLLKESPRRPSDKVASDEGVTVMHNADSTPL